MQKKPNKKKEEWRRWREAHKTGRLQIASAFFSIPACKLFDVCV